MLCSRLTAVRCPASAVLLSGEEADYGNNLYIVVQVCSVTTLFSKFRSACCYSNILEVHYDCIVVAVLVELATT